MNSPTVRPLRIRQSRHLLDVLVARHAVLPNPVYSVPGCVTPSREAERPKRRSSMRAVSSLPPRQNTRTGSRIGPSWGHSPIPASGSGPSTGSGSRTCEITANTKRCSLRTNSEGPADRGPPQSGRVDRSRRRWDRARRSAESVGIISRRLAAWEFADRAGHVASRRATNAQAVSEGCRVAGDPLTLIVSRPGGHEHAQSERSA